MADSPDPTADLLWKIYEENRQTARSHQTMRAGVMNIIIAVTSGIVAFYDKTDPLQQLAEGLLLIGLGVFSFFFTAKYYEREQRCYERAERFYAKLNALVPGAELDSIHKEVAALMKKRYGVLYAPRLHHFWNVLPVIVVLVGAFIAYSASQPRSPSASDRTATALEKLTATLQTRTISH